MKTGKVVAFGALVGTTFALLFAPQKGKNVRIQMKGDNNLRQLGKGYKNLFSEFFRVVWAKLPVSSEKNPFKITALKKQ